MRNFEMTSVFCDEDFIPRWKISFEVSKELLEDLKFTTDSASMRILNMDAADFDPHEEFVEIIGEALKDKLREEGTKWQIESKRSKEP